MYLYEEKQGTMLRIFRPQSLCNIRNKALKKLVEVTKSCPLLYQDSTTPTLKKISKGRPVLSVSLLSVYFHVSTPAAQLVVAVRFLIADIATSREPSWLENKGISLIVVPALVIQLCFCATIQEGLI